MKLFSPEWCERSKDLWNEIALPRLLEPEKFHYVIQWELADGSAASQTKVEAGKCVRWDTGTPDPDPGFIASAKPQIWKNLGDGKLDPMGGITSKRLHLKKGPVAVAINEIAAFKTIIPVVMSQDIDWDDLIES